MTSCLNTVSYIALERIYETHGDHLNDIIFANSIGLRMFRPEIGQYMLGFCVGLMPTLYHNEFIDCTDDIELTNSFWRIAWVWEASSKWQRKIRIFAAEIRPKCKQAAFYSSRTFESLCSWHECFGKELKAII